MVSGTRQGKTLVANVHHNHFTLNPDYSWAIYGEWLEDAVIHHNTVKGSSEWAMLFGFDAAFVELMNQKMALGKEFMPWDPRHQALPPL